jgi:hypothetical protein
MELLRYLWGEPKGAALRESAGEFRHEVFFRGGLAAWPVRWQLPHWRSFSDNN